MEFSVERPPGRAPPRSVSETLAPCRCAGRPGARLPPGRTRQCLLKQRLGGRHDVVLGFNGEVVLFVSSGIVECAIHAKAESTGWHLYKADDGKITSRKDRGEGRDKRKRNPGRGRPVRPPVEGQGTLPAGVGTCRPRGTVPTTVQRLPRPRSLGSVMERACTSSLSAAASWRSLALVFSRVAILPGLLFRRHVAAQIPRYETSSSRRRWRTSAPSSSVCTLFSSVSGAFIITFVTHDHSFVSYVYESFAIYSRLTQ